MQAFDAVHSPLTGISLIEASAGTGKTYTIATLILRLVVEQALPVHQILVVTFTNAATEELRDRIRSRLQVARLACEHGSSKDVVLAALLLKWQDLEAAKTRLDQALQSFDEAPVFTIHGFCQRVLREHALETGNLFDTELIRDEKPLLQAIVEDFWRQQLYQHPSSGWIDYLLRTVQLTPEKLHEEINAHIGKPDLRFVPEKMDMRETAPLEAQWLQAYQHLKQLWVKHAEEVRQLLLSPSIFKQNIYKSTAVGQWLVQLDRWLAADSPPPLFDKADKFGQKALKEGLKKGQMLPDCAFFSVFQAGLDIHTQLQQAYAHNTLSLRLQAFQWAQQALKRRKQQQNIQGYDDLMVQLQASLTGAGAERLLAIIRQRYPAALIDEFQDTDPLQYAIFQRIYQVPPAGQQAVAWPYLLFLIGDPKQAIYSFRGADIFAYIQASRQATQRYTLTTNWRSDPALIQAVNHLFRRSPNPFIFAEIPFYPVQAALPNAAHQLLQKNQALSPLQIWWAGGENLSTKSALQAQVPLWVAEEIVQLLSPETQTILRGYQQLDRPLQAGDIAILVRTHRQAQTIQRALRQRRIPSIIYGQGQLFASREAEQLERVLAALVEPWRDDLLRAALVTDFLGVDGKTLAALQQDEHAWEQWLNAFRHYHERWLSGFLPMFRQFMADYSIAERLLGWIDGERRLTNLLHLLECLHQAATGHAGRAPLLRWLSAMRQNPTGDTAAEETLLRLESDDEAVKLITIHKSKGLEYEVVFIPYAWEGHVRKNDSAPFIFHDPQQNGALTLDMGSKNEFNAQCAWQEITAENMRLLYVALTRAKARCYTLWGPVKAAQQAALSMLIFAGAPPDAKEQQAYFQQLNHLAETSGGSIQWCAPPPLSNGHYQPLYVPADQLTAQVFPRGRQIPFRQIGSFSALLASSSRFDLRFTSNETGRDYDAVADVPVERQTVSTALDLTDFPPGARTGELLHHLLEHLDFTAAPEAYAPMVQQALMRYGYAAASQVPLMAWLQAILQTPLKPLSLKLAQLKSNQCLKELEFFFPVQQLTVSGLAAILEASALLDWQRMAMAIRHQLAFKTLQGFMMGYMDLIFEVGGVFYLVDYKTKYLGPYCEDYSLAAMNQAMEQHYYRLQALIYSVALHRYLGLRCAGYDYTRHFGGVYYLFLRGMTLPQNPGYNPGCNPGYGIWFEKMPEKLVYALSNYLTL